MIQRLDPESVYIARRIIELLIDDSVRISLEQSNDIEAIRNRQRYMEEK